MKLIDAMKEKGNPFEIPDCTRYELPWLFQSLGYKVGAEIGVFTGRNLKRYCHVGFQMYGIDPWSPYNDFPVTRSIRNIEKEAIRNLTPYKNCTLIKKLSIDALKDFKDGSLDFVYIDGNHRFDYVAMDLVGWWDKVRKGGAVAGHDYFDPKYYGGTKHVGYVVDAFVKAYEIKNWYIIGRKQIIPGEQRDEALSFLIFKE